MHRMALTAWRPFLMAAAVAWVVAAEVVAELAASAHPTNWRPRGWVVVPEVPAEA